VGVSTWSEVGTTVNLSVEGCSVVKLQVGTVRKRYLNKKRLYEYKRVSLNVPRRFHKIVEPLLGKQLQMRVSAKEGVITITLNVSKDAFQP